MDYERSLLLTNPEQWLDALHGLTPSSLLVALDKSAATLDDALLEQQLDVAIASLSNGAFVRTSLRSPKDSSVALHKQKAHFREFAAREKDADDNRKMIVLLEGALNAMHVTTGKQVRWLCWLCSFCFYAHSCEMLCYFVCIVLDSYFHQFCSCASAKFLFENPSIFSQLESTSFLCNFFFFFFLHLFFEITDHSFLRSPPLRCQNISSFFFHVLSLS